MRLIGLAVVLAVSLILAPLAGEGQQTGKVAHIGYLSLLSAARDSPNMEAFRQGLRDLGYVEGQNAVIEARYAAGSLDRLPALAAEIVRLNVDVILAAPTPAVRAVQQATRTIPIVMAFSGDPVGEGFAAGLARPGGNITGVTNFEFSIGGKWLETLKQIAPEVDRVALIFDPQMAPFAGPVAIGDQDGLAAGNEPNVLAEPVLQCFEADRRHVQ